MKMTTRIRILIATFFAISILSPNCFAGKVSSDSLNNKRALVIGIGLPVIHATSIVLFNELWYKNQPRESFHFFNDGKEWNQVDKVGHFHSAFFLSESASGVFKWAGFSSRRSDLYGLGTSFLLMTTIEVLDGYSSSFGASGWDILANIGGMGFYLGQKSLWNEIRIHPKFSFRPTSYSNLRPGVLGSNSMEELFKDYNGQTYWLSFDIDKLLSIEKPGILKWINLAAGYGANNMVFARSSENLLAGYNDYRQFYLALDFDLSHVRSKSGFVNSLLFFINMIHLPAPGLEFNKDGIKLRYLTF